MIQVRFHGRGGHGVKTASRILGTAAFLSGFQVQDSPLYGAERRGAAVVSSCRINRQSLRSRGAITQPSLIVVADETLLEDDSAGVLAGQEFARLVFLNSRQTNLVRTHYRILPPVVGLDLSQRTRDALGSASALSAGLAAAAARLVGVINSRRLLRAISTEFAELGLEQDVIKANLKLARRVFADLPAVATDPGRHEPVQTDDTVIEVPTVPMPAAAPSILATGNATERQTGRWRVERPVVDRDRCTRCGLCFAVCPDAAITLDRDGVPVIDYDHCKGCMLCRARCPLAAIHLRRETRAW